jgi:SHS family lactate transporter-like MFS transporter
VGSVARRRAFIAAFLGWMLDGYDFTILTLVLIDIGRDFKVDHAALGALGTVTLVMRLAGGMLAGAAADRWGRKRPLIISIAWFSVFAFLSGLAPNYAVLLILRALFGLGMGGEWAAGMPLVLEHFPESRRGLVLGVLQGAFSWGFILAAAAYQYLGPVVSSGSIPAWRVLLWIGIVPAVLVFWIRTGVEESPAWLAGRARSAGVTSAPVSVLFRPSVLQAALALAAMMFSYQAMSFWYASLLRDRALEPLVYLVALNIGGIAGAALWGQVADTPVGPRRAIAIGSALSLGALPLFLRAESPAALVIGALGIGLTGAGIIGVAPAFVGGRFDAASRGTGWGVVYHAAAAAGAIAPYLIGWLQDAGWPLATAMAACIAGATVVTLALTVLPLRRG